MSFQYAFSRPTSGHEEEIALIESYLQAGYAGLQLKWNQYTPYLHNPEQFIARWGQPEGIASALITGGTLLDDESKNQLRQLYSFAEKVGSEIIVYCHAISRKDIQSDQIAKYASIFEEMGKEAKQHGLQLSLHHHYDQPLMYREDFDIFFDEIKDASSVGLTVDTAHLVKSGIYDVAEVIRSFAPYINNFHMKDFAHGDYQILGHGEIDFKPIFEAVKQIGYNGWISADEESGGSVSQGLQECIAFMKSGLGE
ncbi:sugar phosphate isomerase/epimerase family protein [Paenibacillus sinopodophylli]|uniref:sugar phosphate isomerase/epimerase family protein n=1 Tax=Paenibacillus sinopodophylli TaxID=1837342 RepID=UPI00110CCFD2|nr:sugar phosphate isomerase/epimerase [Paenibacillus sinopodophylli]